MYLALGRLLWGRRALASALTCLILALVILIPLFSLLTIIASQALEFSSPVSRGLQTGHLWQWVAAKLDAVKGYLHHLNLPLPPEQIKLESIVQTVLTRAGAEISKGVLVLIFGTGNPQEVVLAFLDSDRHDEDITKKDAKGELAKLLRRDFGFDAPEGAGLHDLRRRLARYVLLTDLVSGLGDAVLSKLASASVASMPRSRDACSALTRAWRLRRDTRESYVAAAQQVEQEFGLATVEFDPQAIMEIETFPAIERALLRHAENRLLERTDGKMFILAESRLSRFWCDVEPKLQARWALVASATEVLLEADRVEQALKKAPASVTDMIKEYAESAQPWCMLDTHHRHMESRWHNFESYGDDLDSIEKLVVKARQRYVEVGSDIARHFVGQLQNRIPDKGVARQREVFEKHVKPVLGNEKVAYVWVDALRFEMARELVRILKEDFEVELYPALAAVPTVTEIGMAALGGNGSIPGTAQELMETNSS